ncbi:hypothetical protein [Actinocrispum sp. NPDC049592]|uniref:hypothetical protein n=1 Tax=Actinocrispum sp. NPDC049592 TaxID=3154835 RepID=UPI00341FE7E8
MRYMIKGDLSAEYARRLSLAGVLLEARDDHLLIEVSSAEEAAEWASRAPSGPAEVVSVAR